MTDTATAADAQDLVPLQERLRHFWLFRLVAVACVPLFTLLLGSDLLVSTGTLVLVTLLYLGLAGAIDLGWRWAQSRMLGVFAAILILDALYLAWIAYAAGESQSPLRYLTVVHLVVVALLASYRTGLKLALWHSVLAFSTYYARTNEAVGAQGFADGRTEYRGLIGFVVLFWLVTLATVTFSAVNERELRRRRYDLEALAALSDDVETAQTPQQVAETLVRHLADDFGFGRMVVVGGPRDVLTLLATHKTVGRPSSTYEDGEESVLRRVLESRRPLLVRGLDAETDRWLATALPDAGNLVVAPLTSDARAFGVVVLEHSMREGSRVERRVMDMTERFVAHAALALENAFLVEQLRQSASTDGLTGIANRRSFDVTLDRYLARAMSSFEPVSLVLLDIDHFKLLNDEHGHQVGDDVLKQVAAVLVEHARVIDVPARYGGEEFAVVLPECDAEEGLAVAERLRQALAAAPTAVPITVSAGVATFPVSAASTEALIRAADDALYEAKRTGRDRVMTAEPARAAGEVV